MSSSSPKAITLRTIVTATTLALAVALGSLLHPTLKNTEPPPALAAVVPKQFGVWRELSNPMLQVDISVPNESTSRDQPYDDSVSRTYSDASGHQVMLALAYGRNQRQEVKIHRPELCYPAQGFKVNRLEPVSFPIKSLNGEQIIGNRMIATNVNNNHTEAVSYWIRIGSIYSQDAVKTRIHILKEGLQGRRTDGVLVRVSQQLKPGQDPQDLFKVQEQFAADLAQATSASGQKLLIN
ncbi:MAG: exosortase C-terminal domain/associated protein EpsI [Pseudomonadota bacterium]